MINESIPTHVAIIMDGNGRWAKKHGKKRSEGHLAGSKILKRLAIHAAKRGIKILSVFAFSTENFKRSEEEVTYLMDLLIKYFKKEIKTFQKYNIRVKISGRKDRLREDVLKAIDNVEDKTSKNTGGIGVGLTIVKSIIDLHQGTIEVRSELNKGSEFIVILPNL